MELLLLISTIGLVICTYLGYGLVVGILLHLRPRRLWLVLHNGWASAWEVLLTAPILFYRAAVDALI